MEFMLDTVNLAEIKKWAQILPLAGVTSNPTIIKREGELDFFEHLKKVRELIGPQPSLHVQVVAKDTAGIVAEAKKLQPLYQDPGHPRRLSSDQTAKASGL